MAEDEVERIVRQELETKLIKMLSAAIKEHLKEHGKEHSKDHSETAASTLSRQFLYFLRIYNFSKALART